MLKRMRKLKLKNREQLTVIKKKTERRDKIRMHKAEKRINIELEIENELFDRLKLGTYGTLYDDLVNLDEQKFKEKLNNEDLIESEIEDLEDLQFEFEEEIENNLEYIMQNEDEDEEASENNIKKRITKKIIKTKHKKMLEFEEKKVNEKIYN